MNKLTKPTFPVLLLMLSLVTVPMTATAQDKKPADAKPEFEMTILKQIPASSVKSQASTSTCWSFATTSMLESEIMRLGNGSVGLSEMFTVNHVYADKAAQFVMFHGTCNFAEGGAQHDVTNSIKNSASCPGIFIPD